MNLEKKHKALLREMEVLGLADVENARLCFELLTLAISIDRACATRLGKYQMTEGRFVILFLLHSNMQGLSPHQLAEKAGVTRATITGLIDGLQKNKFITRHHDNDDRRMITIRLTSSGAQLAKQLFEDHSLWIASLFSNLTAEEKILLKKLIEKVWNKTITKPDEDAISTTYRQKKRVRVPYTRKELD